MEDKGSETKWGGATDGSNLLLIPSTLNKHQQSDLDLDAMTSKSIPFNNTNTNTTTDMRPIQAASDNRHSPGAPADW